MWIDPSGYEKCSTSNKKASVNNEIIQRLIEAPIIEKLNTETGMLEPYMKMIEGDDYKLILRRDYGAFAHGDLPHWNLEVQTKSGKIKYDKHIYYDDNGEIDRIVDWIP